MTRGAKLPVPEAFVLLGTVRRFSISRDGGILARYHWGPRGVTYTTDQAFDGDPIIRPQNRPPQLLWAPDIKALFMFPGFTVERASFHRGDLPRRAQKAARVFHAWDRYTQWPETSCAEPSYPEPKVRPVGSAFDIVYRSQKWNGKDGRQDDYQHHFSKSGKVRVSMDNPCRPTCVVVQGGRLTVNDRGIVY